MSYKELLEGLDKKDKIELAARLTQAAMSPMCREVGLLFDHETNRDLADLAYSFFCEFLRLLEELPNPETIQPLLEKQKEWRERSRSLGRTEERK